MTRIKALRLEKNMSQRDVANALHCSQKAVACWERETSEPSANFVIALADLFECSADYVLGRENDFGQINVNSNLTEEERKLLFSFSKLKKKDKEELNSFIEYLLYRS